MFSHFCIGLLGRAGGSVGHGSYSLGHGSQVRWVTWVTKADLLSAVRSPTVITQTHAPICAYFNEEIVDGRVVPRAQLARTA